MSTELTKAPSNAPDFMLAPEYADVNAALNEFVSPPRLKIVQGTAKPPLSEKFSPGDVCLMPTMNLVATKGKPFSVVPIFFYPEWLVCNPLEADTFIADRSLDPKSDIAAASRDPKKRKIPWEKDPSKFVSFQETLTFLFAIVGHEELMGTVCAASFARAEHKSGSNLASLIKFRRVPMFGTVWDAVTKQRSNPSGTWWGFNFSQCESDNGFVADREVFMSFEKLNKEFKKAYDDRAIVVNYDDTDVAEPAATANPEF